MYLRRINVNLYQDIKVLTHYCSTIGKPISGLDIYDVYAPRICTTSDPRCFACEKRSNYKKVTKHKKEKKFA